MGVVVGARVDVDDGRVAGAIVADSGATTVAVTTRGESIAGIVGDLVGTSVGEIMVVGGRVRVRGVNVGVAIGKAEQPAKANAAIKPSRVKNEIRIFSRSADRRVRQHARNRRRSCAFRL